jgi:hypothetical protein
MAPRGRRIGGILLLAVAAATAIVPELAQAQTLDDGWALLDNKSGRVRTRFQSLLKGTEKFDASDKGQVEVVDLIAKRHTYGIVVNHAMVKPPDTGVKGPIEKDILEFDGHIQTFIRDRASLQGMADVFCDKVRLHAKEVLDLDNQKARPIQKIHNARLLAKAAQFGQGAFADTLLAVLKDSNQNDGVRYYILRGLATLLAQVQPGTTNPVLSKDELAKCATGIVEFLEQRKGPAKKAPREEIDGFCLLRREAVRALANIHTPSINDKVRPALVLARFAGNDERIQPPPRIDERVAASIGLARMMSAQDKLYQPDYAAAQIAKCLGTFGQMVKNERANGKDFPTSRPWIIDATLLREALAALKTDSGKNKYVETMVDKAGQLLRDVVSAKDIQANDLVWWTSAESDPPSRELFQGAADSTVKTAPPGGEGGTEK